MIFQNPIKPKLWVVLLKSLDPLALIECQPENVRIIGVLIFEPNLPLEEVRARGTTKPNEKSCLPEYVEDVAVFTALEYLYRQPDPFLYVADKSQIVGMLKGERVAIKNLNLFVWG